MQLPFTPNDFTDAPPVTDEQLHQAGLVVASRAKNLEDAQHLLGALGITEGLRNDTAA